MDDTQFGRIVTSILETAEETLAAKSKEYAYGDRLSNFKRAGALLEAAPEKALQGMLTKHIVSVFDMIDNLDKTCPPMRLWDEKIIDIIGYMVLLRALLAERPSTLDMVSLKGTGEIENI